jgi:hypothetical protein
VTIVSAAEEQFVRANGIAGSCLSAASSEVLTGLLQTDESTEPAGGWTWVTGEEVTYSNWRAGEPNDAGGEDVGYLNIAGGWNDGGVAPLGCAHSAVIEWSADCNNDGIVDYGQILAGELVDTNGNNIPDCCEQGVDCRFTAVQWRVEDGGNGHWYEHRIESDSVSWFQARDRALGLGGYLATLKSPAENAFAFALISPSFHQPGAWLGGYQLPGSTEPGGGWVWVDGEPFGWANWNGLAPNNSFCGLPIEDHLHFLDGVATWNDLAAEFDTCVAPIRHYVVEWSADCNSDGIVDYGQIRSGELADANGNYIPDCCEATPPCGPCLADVDGSGAVNGVDLAAILNTWGTSGGKYPGADVNSDGIVNGADLAEVLNSWGPCP